MVVMVLTIYYKIINIIFNKILFYKMINYLKKKLFEI